MKHIFRQKQDYINTNHLHKNNVLAYVMDVLKHV